MLTPNDFSVIPSLKLGGERIEGHDTISPTKVKDYLGVNPPRVSGNNVSLMWLDFNIEKCKSVEIGTWMVMLFFIRSLLCPNLGSIVSLCYLWSLRDIRRINNYDWGGMAYATLLQFMTQLSKRSISSLGGALFVWSVRKKNWSCVFCKGYLCCCWQLFIFVGLDVWIFQSLAIAFGRCCWSISKVLALDTQEPPFNTSKVLLEGLANGDWQLRHLRCEFPLFFLSSLVEVQFGLFHVGMSFKFWTPVNFRWTWILRRDVRVILNVHWLWSWTSIRSYLNVTMGGIGILEIECFHWFTMCTLLKWFLLTLVLWFGLPAL